MPDPKTVTVVFTFVAKADTKTELAAILKVVNEAALDGLAEQRLLDFKLHCCQSDANQAAVNRP